MSQISAKRSILSYARVQAVISPIVRGRELFMNKKRMKDKVLLNVGCGPVPKDHFINLDYFWCPEIDVCWDITAKKYPFPDNSLEGVYTEHCLEHIPYEKCFENLKEFHRILKPGGTLRIIVPDAEIYLNAYQAKKTDEKVRLPYDENEETPIISINRIFRGHGHLFIYDFQTLQMNLSKIGFRNITKEAHGKGRDPRLLIDRADRAVESLYVEATK
ncbi:MAG TPA: methyltransferase domain-containing protein [Puia sp.]|nr:methyltransferase domain-containing protein [Puia sp.]